MGGYFTSEGEAWNSVTQDGYVRVLRIDADFAEEEKRDKEALELYAKLQKKWRLASYEEMVSKEGAEKAHANITLRFYEDALESFKPKTRRERRSSRFGARRAHAPSCRPLLPLDWPRIRRKSRLSRMATRDRFNISSTAPNKSTSSNSRSAVETSGKWAKFQGIEVEHQRTTGHQPVQSLHAC